MSDFFVVVAAASNRVIGVEGRLPWHIPADLRRFKALTMGRPMVMGRKTFESLPGMLPGRRHIVLTRDAHWRATGAEPAASLEAAIALAGAAGAAVIGGAEVFAMVLARAARIELTEVHADFAGDTFLPPLGPDNVGGDWREAAREEHAAGLTHPAFAFVTLMRAPTPAPLSHEGGGKR